MKQIKGKQYSVAVYNLATILVPVGFAPLFGGGVKETLVSAAVGCILAFLITLGKKNPDEQLYFECNLCIRG